MPKVSVIILLLVGHLSFAQQIQNTTTYGKSELVLWDRLCAIILNESENKLSSLETMSPLLANTDDFDEIVRFTNKLPTQYAYRNGQGYYDLREWAILKIANDAVDLGKVQTAQDLTKLLTNEINKKDLKSRISDLQQGKKSTKPTFNYVLESDKIERQVLEEVLSGNMEQAIKTLKTINRVDSYAISASDVVDKLIDHKLFSEADQIANSIPNQSSYNFSARRKDFILLNIAKAHLRLGEISEAKRYLHQVEFKLDTIRIVNTANELLQIPATGRKSELLLEIAKEHVRQKEFDSANYYIRAIFYKPTLAAKRIEFAVFLDSLGYRSNAKRHIEMALEMPSVKLQDVARAFADIEDFERAEALIETIETSNLHLLDAVISYVALKKSRLYGTQAIEGVVEAIHYRNNQACLLFNYFYEKANLEKKYFTGCKIE